MKYELTCHDGASCQRTTAHNAIDLELRSMVSVRDSKNDCKIRCVRSLPLEMFLEGRAIARKINSGDSPGHHNEVHMQLEVMGEGW